MIGVIDSGIGGLTVLNRIRAHLPEASLTYIADHAFAPYGDLAAEKVTERIRFLSRWLIDEGASIIVIACNTATATSIDAIRQEFPIPFVGVEPGVKPAVLSSKTQTVGILATENTVSSLRYQKLIQRFLPNSQVISQGCSGLADAIEAHPDRVPGLLQQFLAPLIEAGADQIVLGCTHYPLAKSQIASLLPTGTVIVDTSDAIAQEVVRKYSGGAAETGGTRLYTSGDQSAMQVAIGRTESLDSLRAFPVEELP
jgi:glutamate racemase